jgi:hypothetical protein
LARFEITPSAGFTDREFRVVDHVNILVSEDLRQIPEEFRYFVQIQVPDPSEIERRRPPRQLLVDVVNEAGRPDERYAPTEVEMILDLVGNENGMLTYRSSDVVVPYAAPVPDSVPEGVILVYADGGDGLAIVPLGPVEEEEGGSDGSAPVGAPCSADSECAGGTCLPLPGGYCTQANCSTDPCPEGSECFQLSDGGSACFKTCTSPSECRVPEGYTCDSDNTCYPVGP